jgi:hypothetical protein
MSEISVQGRGNRFSKTLGDSPNEGFGKRSARE